jgi:RNA polymerase sigma-70 factor (ECF subfamily)
VPRATAPGFDPGRDPGLSLRWDFFADRDRRELNMSWNEIVNLVVQAQAGDRGAYGELVERFQPAVYAVALARLRNPAEAQELTQEVFVHGMTKLDQLRDPHCFAGWLRQITVRMAINRMTRHAPLQGADNDVLQNAPGAGETPLEEMVRAEQRAELWAGLRRLKAIDRATLVAFYIHGHSLKRMSRDFETPVGTIKRRLHVARNRLREQLEQVAAPSAAEDRAPEEQERELACV